MKKLLLTYLVLVQGLSGVFAQYDAESVMFSRKVYQSDARSVGVGNAFGAVGANFISSSINPAGLAFFRSSEFSISNSFYFSKTETDYLGNRNTDQKFVYNIPSFSFIISNINENDGVPVKDGWVNYTFGVGMNRTNNYHYRNGASGINNTSSIVDYFAENANGSMPANLPYLTGLAYDAYLIDNPDTLNPDQYITAIDTGTTTRNILQSKSMFTRGASSDLNFSFAANFSNKVYVGATLGVPSINYHKTFIFEEQNQAADPENYLGSKYTQTLDVNAIGFNMLIGVIVRPFDFLRFGGSFQTPTVYSVTEDYSDEIASTLVNNSVDPQVILGNYDYRLITPMRATASLALFAGKLGFISVDYEFLDYASTYFESDLYSFNSENNVIKSKYTRVNNLRVGGELKYNVFAFRAGYSIYQSPFNDAVKPVEADGSFNILSFGAGIREKAYSFDIAYQLINHADYYLPYALKNTNVEGAVESSTINNILFTLGMKF